MSNIAKNKSNYKFLWSNYHGLLTVEMYLRSFGRFRNFEWNKVEKIIEVVRKNTIKCYHGKKDLKNDFKRGKSFLDNNYSKNFLEKAEEGCQATEAIFEIIKKEDFSKLSNVDLIELLEKIMNRWANNMSYFRAIQAEGTYELIKEVRKHFSKKEVAELLISPREDIIELEKKDWQLILTKKFSPISITKHLEKYPWLVASHFTRKDILITMKNRYIENKKDVFKDRDTEKQIKIQQDKILSKVKKSIREYIFTIQALSFYRGRIKACWAGCDYYSLPILEEISRRTGESLELIGKYYLSHEIKKLFNGTRLTKKEISQRNDFFVGLWKKGKIIYLSGQKAKSFASKELGNILNIENKKEFIGQIANSGKLTAVARILGANNMTSANNLRKNFKKGQILVTQMTQPNIMDIASRAGGIITDEGGLLSHAAIISRELKIPCIVGTSIATDLIKDGDLIEVDANQGVVRIINN